MPLDAFPVDYRDDELDLLDEGADPQVVDRDDRCDPLRIGGVVVAAIVVLVLSSWAALFVVLILLAAYEAGVTMLARSSGEPEAVEAKSAIIPSEPVTIEPVEPVEPQSRSVVLPAPRTDQAETTD